MWPVVDLVGTVDVDGMSSTSLASSTGMPWCAQPLGALRRCSDTAPVMRSLHGGQRVDEVVHGRAGADADDAAGHHVGDRRLADQRFQFVLGHGAISREARLRQ